MLKVIKGDIWDYYQKGWSVIVPTNGWVNHDGMNVMGKGVALQARKLFYRIEYALGEKIKKHGNHVFYFERQNIFSFPTKHGWKQPSDLDLINSSCLELKSLLKFLKQKENKDLKIVMPKVGCGWGKLKWEQVAPLISSQFGEFGEDKFIIVDNESGETREWRGDNKDNKRDDEHQLFID